MYKGPWLNVFKSGDDYSSNPWRTRQCPMPSGRKQNVGPRGAQLERWACVTERSGKEVEWRWSGKQAVRERRVSSKDAQKMPHLPKFGHFRPFWNRKLGKWHSQCTPTARELSSGVWIVVIGPVVAECKPGQDFGGGRSGRLRRSGLHNDNDCCHGMSFYKYWNKEILSKKYAINPTPPAKLKDYTIEVENMS